ncbi:MAG: hypothetical protein MUC55_00475 [Burkholderiales bacterium]|jgi:hypothetical protein|nr:hypothetical protein [Burkholderiales bacterium]
MARVILAAWLAFALVACGATPPKPPVCEGEYTPINAGVNLDAARRGG